LPLYEYQCDRCGRFEVIQKFSDKPLKVCKKCGGPVQRLLSAPAIQFKGTGWYVTDYARKSGGEGSGGQESKDKAPSASGTASDASAASGKSATAKDETPKKAAAGSKKDK
jgi:putative FmdB family regulatory protein